MCLITGFLYYSVSGSKPPSNTVHRIQEMFSTYVNEQGIQKKVQLVFHSNPMSVLIHDTKLFSYGQVSVEEIEN